MAAGVNALVATFCWLAISDWLNEVTLSDDSDIDEYRITLAAPAITSRCGDMTMVRRDILTGEYEVMH